MNTKIKVIRTGILSVNTLIVPLYEKKVFVIDPATSKVSRDQNKITDYLKKDKLDCVAIILTHSHFDHITGIGEIKKLYPNAVIAIHENEFSELHNNLGPINESVLTLFGLEEVIKEVINQPKAEYALKSNENLKSLANLYCERKSKVDNELIQAFSKWKVLSTPGHTPGSICLYNEQDSLLICGDTLFDYGGYGRTDMYGGDEAVIRKSLNFLRNTIPSGTKCYPGHDSFGFDF